MNHLVSMEANRANGRVYLSRSHEYSRQPESTRVNATYVGLVSLPHTSRVQFARYIHRALDDARGRGMTDADIKHATGVNPSTFHNWQNGKRVPEFVTVQKFCRGLGLNVEDALATLRSDVRQPTAPEPPMDPDVLRLLRRLADPNTSNEIKLQIRATMRYLADLPEPAPAKRTRRRAS